jgi:hypothetical protein
VQIKDDTSSSIVSDDPNVILGGIIEELGVESCRGLGFDEVQRLLLEPIAQARALSSFFEAGPVYPVMLISIIGAVNSFPESQLYLVIRLVHTGRHWSCSGVNNM